MLSPSFFPRQFSGDSEKGIFQMSKRPVRTSALKDHGYKEFTRPRWVSLRLPHLGHAEAYLRIYLDLPPSPGNGKDWGLATHSSAGVPAAARERTITAGAPRDPGSLPMSELQNASWGWLGEHVHASAPQSPRLQLPQGTTSPSQEVIAAAVAGAAARVYKVALRATGRVAAACARPPRLWGGRLWLGARRPPSARRDGMECDGAASALAQDWAGGRSLWAEEQELREQKEEKLSSVRPLPALRRSPAAE